MTETKFRAIIFDFNGVLWWDSHLHEQAWAQFVLNVRDVPLTREESVQHIHGRTNNAIVTYLTGKNLSREEIFELAQQKEDIYRAMCLQLGDDFRIAPKAVELLDFLKECNIPRAIATSSGRDNLDFYLEHLPLTTWFTENRIVYDNGTFPGKPAPDIYRIAAQRLGTPPAQCIVIEDSLSGIASAYAAGIGSIIALSTTSPHEVLAQQAGVSQVMADFDEFEHTMLVGI